jgi:WD40 repeat protein
MTRRLAEMGGIYGSVHVRTSDLGKVVEAARAIAEKSSTTFLVGPPLNGWIGVYPSDHGAHPSVSASLAGLVSADILHLISYKEDVFSYFYYRQGSLVDAYCSYPDYFGEAPSSEPARYSGRPEAFAALLQDPGKVAEIGDILAPGGDPAAAQDMAAVAKFSRQMMKPARTDPQRQMTLMKDPQKSAAQMKDPIPRQLEMPMDASDESMQLEAALESDTAADGDVPPEIRPFPVLVQMFRFAGVFGIKNAISSYEYLRSGETDNIERWSDFVSIPHQSLEQAREDIAAATLSSRIQVLKAAGLLLNVVSRAGTKRENRWRPVWTSDFSDGYLAYWVDSGSSGPADQVVYSASGEVIPTTSHLAVDQSIHALCLSKSGRLLGTGHASRTSQARLYDRQEGRLLRTVMQKHAVPSLAFCDDETVMVTASHDELTIIPTDASQPEVSISIGSTRSVHTTAVHPHYPFIVAADGAADGVDTIVVVDISRLLTVRCLTTSPTDPFAVWVAKAQSGIGPTACRPNEMIRSLSFSPDGRLMFAAVLEGIRVYNWGEVLASENTMPAPIASAQNGLVIAKGGWMQSTHCLAFDSDRNLVLFAGLDGKIRYLDLNSGRDGVLLTLPDEPAIYRMKISTNRTSLCTESVRNLFDREKVNPVELHFWHYQRLLDKSFSKVVRIA